MPIKELCLISATPRKSKKISVLLEVEDTDENIRAFSDLYRKKLVLTTEPKTSPDLEPDSFDLLIDIRTRCQQIQDIITNQLEPLPIKDYETITGLGGEWVQAADEIPVNDFYGDKKE